MVKCMLTITIDQKQYEYIDSILYEGKTYVALSDVDDITICEYTIKQDQVILHAIDDTLFSSVKEAMHLS